jgi:DNA-binding SARP family transcriptional activator
MNARLTERIPAGDLLARPAPVARVQLLGSVQIYIGDENCTSRIKYRKGLALIALLAVECNVMHQRDRIADLLWPELTLTAARSNLRQVLSNLVRVLEPVTQDGLPILRVTGSTLGFFTGAHVHLDVAKVQATCERLRHKSDITSINFSDVEKILPSANATNREFLAGFDLVDCEGFMEWLSYQRHYFSDCLISIYEDISDQAEAVGDLDTALSFVRKAVQIDPLLEANQLRLIRLLATLGRQERALRELNTFVTRLREELDVEPGPETKALRDQIIQGQIKPHSRLANKHPGTGNSRWMTVLYAVCAPSINDSLARTALTRQSREETTEVLRTYGAYVVRPPGRGVFAYFGWSEDQRHCARNALDGAKEVLAKVSTPQYVRIGIYTCCVDFENPSEQLDELGECSDIAYRLSQAADGGEIVVCEETLQKIQAKTEKMRLGQLRGIREAVTLFRILH